MPELLAHRKQYVLGARPVLVRPDWISIRLAGTLVLSHCPKLRVAPLRSRDDIQYYLLGLAVPADGRVASLAEAFRAKSSEEIEGWTGYWAGSWLMISAERCWQDASGTLGIAYRTADGEIWLSSSVVLLSNYLPGVPQAARIPWHVTQGCGIDWVPMPCTTRAGIYKLLPLRSIDPRTGATAPVRDAGFDRAPDRTALATALTTSLSNWSRCGFSTLAVGLTAGLDTRTILAAACAADIAFETFTTIHPFMAARDRALPPRLARCVGAAHRFRTFPPVEPARIPIRMAAISEHLDGVDSHPAFRRCAHCDPDQMTGAENSSANGSCFEVGRCNYWHRLSGVDLREAPPSVDHVLTAFGQRGWRPDPIEAWRHAIQLWIDSLSDQVPLAMDWRDRFYLEQCLASWNSNVQRVNDFVDSTGFSPANCLWIIHLLLQAEPQQRLAGTLQREAIRQMAPRLLDFPVNPTSMRQKLWNATRRWSTRARHGLRSLTRKAPSSERPTEAGPL